MLTFAWLFAVFFLPRVLQTMSLQWLRLLCSGILLFVFAFALLVCVDMWRRVGKWQWSFQPCGVAFGCTWPPCSEVGRTFQTLVAHVWE